MPFYDFITEGIGQSTLKKEERNSKEFPEAYQCINSNCESSTEAACAGDTCVCYNTCPLGKTYYPLLSQNWNSTLLEEYDMPYATSIQIPCSGRGVCRHTGECVCKKGYIGDNCQEYEFGS